MWTNEYNPTTSEWFVCIVQGKRIVLHFNVPNKFWCDLIGKTYKPNEVMWLDDYKIKTK